MSPSKESSWGSGMGSQREGPFTDGLLGRVKGQGTPGNWNRIPLGFSADLATAAHLALPENVPEQRQVLRSEVPERSDAPAMADGNQVQVIELHRDWQGSMRLLGGQSQGRPPILESFMAARKRLPPGLLQCQPQAIPGSPGQDRPPGDGGLHMPGMSGTV